jgi:hypothetical protein
MRLLSGSFFCPVGILVQRKVVRPETVSPLAATPH